MLLYTNIITPRLKYISDFIGRQITGEPFKLTTNIELFKNFQGPKLNYSSQMITDEEFWIPSRTLSGSELLFENNISPQRIDCFETKSYKAFFKVNGEFPFDIFAASFYLLSRYEEYLPHQKDSYGRYAHENSIAFKESFLHLPLVNIWLGEFAKTLQEKYPSFTIHHSPFTFTPTYDIDIAYSYLQKGFRRNTIGLIKSFVTFKWLMFADRWKTIRGNKIDPYDSYKWLHLLHRRFNLKPIYFFLLAFKRSRYDKNIHPSKKAMSNLIRSHLNYEIGIHPSWRSFDHPKRLKKEIAKLHEITGKEIRTSRQHYIRFDLPQTFRQLIKMGIHDDYSMGYGSINGFRASVTTSFYWYDLEKDEPTSLLLHPFCFMDANSFYEQKYSPQQASDELRYYHDAVKAVNGNLITIWHNSFLGRDKIFEGWKEVYEQFIFDSFPSD
jgi:uncharacterized protein DUF7033